MTDAPDIADAVAPPETPALMRPPVGVPTRLDRWLAWGLAALTVAVVWGTQRPVGYVRDEGYYFTAASDYEGWFVELGKDISAHNWAQPFRDEVIRRYWSYNHEHPALDKTLFALSHLVFHRNLHWLDDSTAFRLPAFVIAGLLAWALFWLARPAGRAAGVFAPLLFFAVPRHFFHAHLAAFDLPVVASWMVFLLFYSRSIETGRGAWKAGLFFGLALATKHNALFLPFILLPHWILSERSALWRDGVRGFWRRIPRAWSWMILLGPVVLYLHWPYLWHHPIDGVNEWLSFHFHHVNYSWQYFGTVLREPPFPVLYPLALEALTVPAATLVLLALAVLLLAARMLGAFVGPLRRVVGEATGIEWLVAIGAAVAIGPFMLTTTPIFGGVKHWMAGPALLCVSAAEVVVLLGRALWPARSRLMIPALAALVLLPGAQAVAHFHPYGTSAYNEIAGGGSGGAALGMQRQYWSNNVTAVLPWLNAHAPRGARVFFHEVNSESFHAYQENGWLRRDISYAWSPRDLDDRRLSVSPGISRSGVRNLDGVRYSHARADVHHRRGASDRRVRAAVRVYAALTDAATIACQAPQACSSRPCPEDGRAQGGRATHPGLVPEPDALFDPAACGGGGKSRTGAARRGHAGVRYPGGAGEADAVSRRGGAAGRRRRDPAHRRIDHRLRARGRHAVRDDGRAGREWLGGHRAQPRQDARTSDPRAGRHSHPANRDGARQDRREGRDTAGGWSASHREAHTGHAGHWCDDRPQHGGGQFDPRHDVGSRSGDHPSGVRRRIEGARRACACRG